MKELLTNVTFIAAILAFVIGFVNFIVTFTLSKKNRHSQIISNRRKERMDNFIIYYSKISSLVHPDTIFAYASNNDNSYFEKLNENFSNINMLFDHRYEKDVVIVDSISKLVKKAISYYHDCKSSEFCEKLKLKYKNKYRKNIFKVDMLLNVYIGTEWSRLVKEVGAGETVCLEKWNKLYDESLSNYFKWKQ